MNKPTLLAAHASGRLVLVDAVQNLTSQVCSQLSGDLHIHILQTQVIMPTFSGGLSGSWLDRIIIKSCCRGWGGFSPVPPSSQRLGFPWEAADWHPDCQPDDGSYQENQT
ncbi:uncharacterized protein LOC130177571 isoform X2 [Seriola aureovittata]|uniref:uncharacterized protein LOC130177571 isoform X2 n=1 Tax=Seriola aureovittata TaxID=2871759 RepID=UPI0024BDF9E6|nr:uncharacterized protein LOC130177571 isoform X2 [Seriola aureovittata]